MIDVSLIYCNLLIGGEPGSGKSAAFNAAVVRAALASSGESIEGGKVDCLACPPWCRECSQDESTCECYTHAHLHPDNEPAGPEVV